MNAKQLESLLGQWGDAYMAHSAGVEPRSLTGDNLLSRYGKPSDYEPVATRRSGKSRRIALAVAAGGAAVGLRIAPLEYSDPVPCTATRIYRAPRYDSRETSDVERVQSAWLALYRVAPLQANVVRVEYQERGRQSDKAAGIRIRADVGGERKAVPLRLKRYRDELRLAKAWLAGRLSESA
jgi:hypothetical protein